MSYTSDNVNYAYTVPSSGSTGIAKVVSSPSATGSITILDSFTVDSILYTVTSIGANAFNSVGRYAALHSIIIPNTITSIGLSAFFGCSNLTSVTFTATSSLTSIGDGAFRSCINLTNIIIPDSVTSISANAFRECFSLTSVTIPNSVTIINTTTFAYCSSLTSVTIPNSVTSIGRSAFFNCSSLTSITIPNSVTSLIFQAFLGCSSLASITIPNSVTSIETNVFFGCTSLTNFVTYANVTSNINYSSVILPIINYLQNVTFGFAGQISDNACANCVNLQNVTIGPLITNLGLNTFTNCGKLTSNSITQMLAAGFTIMQLYAAGITLLQMFAVGITMQQMSDAGITITKVQMFLGGIITTIQELIDAGITFKEMYDGGITIAQLQASGITIKQMFDAGLPGSAFLVYNISEITNNTILTYDTTKTLETVCTDVDEAVYNIPVSNFKYYNLTTNTYTSYTNICISTNGWFGFTNSIAEISYGDNAQVPLNTLRYFSFDGISTIKYYFDSSNNLFISAVGTYSVGLYNIIIKISPTGLIQVYYSSIGSIYRNPIIGFVGNNSFVSTDDIFYSTFNGTGAFVKSNINGKLLSFDCTGLSFLITANTLLSDIYTYTSAHGYTQTDISAIVPTTTAPVISSINGTSPTILNPTVSITINPSSIDASTTNYYYSIDGLPFVLLSPAQTISPLTIPISGLTSGTSHTFAIKAYNGSDSIASETSAPTIVYIQPEAPTNLVANISGNTALITFEQTENANVTSYTYAYSIDGDVTYSEFSSINLTLISATQISISGLINGKTYYFKLKSSNGVNSYSIESTQSNSVFVNFAQPAPKIQLVSAINTELSISFTQDKYATAYDIISYELSVNGGLTYITIPNTTGPFQVPLLSSTNATYSVILKANNGILSAPSNTFTLRKINRIGKIV